MVNSGKVSCTRRREAVEKYIASAHSSTPGKEPPKRKSGRPKKSHGFQKKRIQKASLSPSNLTPPRSSVKRSTRSNSRPPSTRKKSPPSLYPAEPAPATKVGSFPVWHKKRNGLENAIKTLTTSNTLYRKIWYSSLAEIQQMNSKLVRPGFEEKDDGPIITDDSLEDLSNEEISSFVKKCFRSSDPHNSQMRSILADVGLACNGRRLLDSGLRAYREQRFHEQTR